MGYQRLAQSDRYQIEALKKSGLGVREIARELKRPPSTISRELKANGNWMGYFASTAQELSDTRKKDPDRAPDFKIKDKLETNVRDKLKLEWSPEQIGGRLLREQDLKVSYSTIYRYIYREARSGGCLWTHLRTYRKKRKIQKRSILASNFNSLKEVRPMKDRPKIVDKKIRLGDLERDLVCGTKQSAVIMTINDRVSRRVKLCWMPRKSADLVHQKTVALLRHCSVKTLTNDNGSEFARHKKTEKHLGALIYFSRKGCSWERGANENMNGLLRQYFPRSTDFDRITLEQIKHAEARLNSRPRKCLGYQTPNEVHRILGQVLR